MLLWFEWFSRGYNHRWTTKRLACHAGRMWPHSRLCSGTGTVMWRVNHWFHLQVFVENHFQPRRRASETFCKSCGHGLHLALSTFLFASSCLFFWVPGLPSLFHVFLRHLYLGEGLITLVVCSEWRNKSFFSVSALCAHVSSKPLPHFLVLQQRGMGRKNIRNFNTLSETVSCTAFTERNSKKPAIITIPFSGTRAWVSVAYDPDDPLAHNQPCFSLCCVPLLSVWDKKKVDILSLVYHLQISPEKSHAAVWNKGTDFTRLSGYRLPSFIYTRFCPASVNK